MFLFQTKENKGTFSWDIHYWLGKETTQVKYYFQLQCCILFFRKLTNTQIAHSLEPSINGMTLNYPFCKILVDLARLQFTIYLENILCTLMAYCKIAAIYKIFYKYV